MSLIFDRSIFFAQYKARFGGLTQSQVDGLNFILDSAAQDPHLQFLEWLAYMLATTKLETANTFQPIHEYGSLAYFVKRYGSQTAVGKRLGNATPEEGATYAGVGDVQLTGHANFQKAEIALREQYPEIVAAFETRTGKHFDLTVGDQPNDAHDPENAGDPAIAYAIMSYGMRTGMFTGRKLADYINPPKKDYVNARRIINGLDRAKTIGGCALDFEKILTAALTSSDANTSGVSAIDPALAVATATTLKDNTAKNAPDTSQPEVS